MELLSVTMNDGVMPRSEIEGKDSSSEDKSNYKVVCKGDMVYNSMRMWQGANGVSDYDGIVSPAYTVLMPTKEIDNQYFAALFKTSKLINEFRKNSQGLTSDTWNLKYPQIRPIRLHIPSLQEQHKLSAFIGTLEERISKQRQLVDSLKKYKRGLLNLVFSSKKSSWTKKRIGEFCNITMGQSPDSSSYNSDCVGVPLVQGNADITDGVTTPLRYTSQPTKVCKKGSILLSVRAPVGTVCIADREVCLGRGVCAINSENNAFVRQLFLYLEPSWKTIEQGGTFTAISRNDIANVEVIIPNDAAEQKRIGEHLGLIDLHISQEVRMLQSIMSTKLGLMQQLFI